MKQRCAPLVCGRRGVVPLGDVARVVIEDVVLAVLATLTVDEKRVLQERVREDPPEFHSEGGAAAKATGPLVIRSNGPWELLDLTPPPLSMIRRPEQCLPTYQQSVGVHES